MNTYFKSALLANVGFVSLSICAQAAYRIDIAEIGNDVGATSQGGSLNIDYLEAFDLQNFSVSPIVPELAVVLTGPSATNFSQVVFYKPPGQVELNGPNSFGTKNITYTDVGSGSSVGISGHHDRVIVPAGYVSGAALGPSSSTWTGMNFNDLGLIEGLYIWSWPVGDFIEIFTVQIGETPTPVPEPSALVLRASAIGLLGFMGWKRGSN